ncbi:eukaryotic translation initiation factor 2-alpha kinase [Nilaparvata lugens]|uniref:eukaryotic translation initiation factor 2-alpha kinase n=1 Tax=Nilaparvata lugens TaxID=108931 RepID=UPI00193D9CD3|nr:eukaryotic translation initiation factor 2-alpha kinase [Nilaparvata lugens]
MFCNLLKCLIAVFLVSTSVVSIKSDDEIESLPFCGPSSGSNYKSKKLMFVSTLDGQVSMLNIADGGTKEWSVPTGPGPMLESNIHKLELTNNGQWVRMIPSLAGGLYKFNGEYIEAIPVNAEHLLKSSFRYSDDLVISGGKESRTYGVEVDSGRVLYECTMQSCNNITDEVDDQIGDVVLVQRMTQTIRAVEPRTGTERWNFSVAQHDVKFSPNPSADCHYVNDPSSEIMLKVIVPEGLICALSKSQPNKVLWTHKFESPVVSAWRLDEGQLIWVDLFGGKTPPLLQSAGGEGSVPDSPALYVGMHKKQLYIQESVTMQTMLQSVASQYKQHLIGADKAFPRIPWQPIPAIASALELRRLLPGHTHKDVLQITDESSSQALATTTANSVLYGSEYVNGNGFYLYTPETSKKIQTGLCHPEDEQNITITQPTPEEEFNKEFEEADTSVQVIMVSLSYYWREVCVISISTAILLNLLIHHRAIAPFLRAIQEIVYTLKAIVLYSVFGVRNLKEFQTKILEVDISQDGDSTGSQLPSNAAADYTSRYLTDFDPVHCLGKGGFGVVFEAKNKIDDCHYAVKRIPLPSREDARERVMREVKALAKLDHKNIVRYFNAWQECPPPGWQEAQDKYWKEKSSSKNAFEDVITIDPLTPDEPPSTAELLSKNMSSNLYSNCKLNNWGKSNNNADISDSYIVFEASNPSCTKDSAGDQVKSGGDSVIPISVTSSDYSEQSYSSYDFDKSKQGSKPRRPNSLLLKSEDSATATDNSRQVNLRMFLFIQMQLCRKDSLREWLRDINRPRDVNLAINIFEQIVHAVEYVHLKGLIHRDLKPSNIFFSLDGQIKVGDFGLVTAMVESAEQFVPQDKCPKNSSTSLSSREKHTARVGTHLYMSPEQVQGKPYSYKVDIYSLGLILFELLVPFSTEMERAQTLQDLRKNRFPSHFQTNFNQEYQLLSLMLSHRPEERPTTYGIRAKPPLQKTPTIDDDVTWHFDLPLRRKTSSCNSNSFDS